MTESLEALYQIQLIHHDGSSATQVALIDAFENLEYVIAVNGMDHHGWGYYRFRGESEKTYSDLFDLDHILVVRRKPPGQAWATDFEGLHRKWTYELGNDDIERFTSEGTDLRSLLKRRIILPPAGEDFLTVTDAFTDIMRFLVYTQMGAGVTDALRQMPSLIVEADTGQGTTLDNMNFRWTNLDEELERISGVGADFDIERNDATLTFRVYYPRYGTDHRQGNPNPVVFSLSVGNIATPIVGSDRLEEVTYVYVGGDGVGANRQIEEEVSVYNAQDDSPWNRIEEFLEARQDYGAGLLGSTGLAFLEEHREQLTFQCVAIPCEGCLYGVHWSLGDLVTGRYRGVDYDLRIVEVHVTLSSGGESIRPTFLWIPT